MPSKTSPPVPLMHPPLGTVIDDDTLQLVEVLGVGGYGVVYRAEHVLPYPLTLKTSAPQPKSYAVKCLLRSSQSPRARQIHIKEVTLHQLASSHPGVVSLHRVIEDSDHTWIIMEYATSSDLFTQILHHSRYLADDILIRDVFLQILDAVEWFHSLGIYHRDLKPENILCWDDGRTVKVTDFGLATTERWSEEWRTGSVYHMSPECQGSTPSSGYCPQQNDIWSLGIILLNLITGRNPWKAASLSDPTYIAYLQNPLNFLPTVLPISEQCNRLVRGMLDPDPDLRTGIDEVRSALLHGAVDGDCADGEVFPFYSEDVVFEGSMAKCGWEVGMAIHAADSEPSQPAQPPVEVEISKKRQGRRHVRGYKRTRQQEQISKGVRKTPRLLRSRRPPPPPPPEEELKSHWSEDSDMESDIIFAHPPESNSLSVNVSEFRPDAASANASVSMSMWAENSSQELEEYWDHRNVDHDSDPQDFGDPYATYGVEVFDDEATLAWALDEGQAIPERVVEEISPTSAKIRPRRPLSVSVFEPSSSSSYSSDELEGEDEEQKTSSRSPSTPMFPITPPAHSSIAANPFAQKKNLPKLKIDTGFDKNLVTQLDTQNVDVDADLDADVEGEVMHTALDWEWSASQNRDAPSVHSGTSPSRMRASAVQNPESGIFPESTLIDSRGDGDWRMSGISWDFTGIASTEPQETMQTRYSSLSSAIPFYPPGEELEGGDMMVDSKSRSGAPSPESIYIPEDKIVWPQVEDARKFKPKIFPPPTPVSVKAPLEPIQPSPIKMKMGVLPSPIPVPTPINNPIHDSELAQKTSPSVELSKSKRLFEGMTMGMGFFKPKSKKKIFPASMPSSFGPSTSHPHPEEYELHQIRLEDFDRDSGETVPSRPHGGHGGFAISKSEPESLLSPFNAKYPPLPPVTDNVHTGVLSISRSRRAPRQRRIRRMNTSYGWPGNRPTKRTGPIVEASSGVEEARDFTGPRRSRSPKRWFLRGW